MVLDSSLLALSLSTASSNEDLQYTSSQSAHEITIFKGLSIG
jgi:hypothetical protein